MNLIRLYSYMIVFIPHYFVGYFLVTAAFRAYYLKATGYDKWWVSFIPFGHIYYRRDLAGVNLWLLIPLIVFEIIAISGSPYPWIVVWLLNALANYFFGTIYLNKGNALVFGFVPLAKYFVMWKEIQVCQKCNRVKNT